MSRTKMMNAKTLPQFKAYPLVCQGWDYINLHCLNFWVTILYSLIFLSHTKFIGTWCDGFLATVGRNVKSWVDNVRHHVKPLLVMLERVPAGFLAAWFSMQFSTKVRGSSAWAPANHVKDPDGVPKFWLQPGSAWALVVIGEKTVNGNFLSLFLFLSIIMHFKQTNESPIIHKKICLFSLLFDTNT